MGHLRNVTGNGNAPQLGIASEPTIPGVSRERWGQVPEQAVLQQGPICLKQSK